jgi:5-methyltetrahydropteroyltriglutamate--homocysteine methyltransferase
MPQRSVPPFRADMVGSLLRTAPLKAAREHFAAGKLDASGLAAIEDAEIKKLIAKQESIGLQAITDGEFRRTWWHYDYFWSMIGVERAAVAQGIQFTGVQTKAEAPKVAGKLGFGNHPMLSHFQFLAANTKGSPKMTIPGPSMLHYRGGRSMIMFDAYPTMEQFYSDLGAAYAKGIKAFHDVGCRYLQLDDISFAYLCDPKQLEMLRARGDDPAQQPHIYARRPARRYANHDAPVPGQLPLDLRRVRGLRADRGPVVQHDAGGRLFHGMGQRALGRVRAVAILAEG